MLPKLFLPNTPYNTKMPYLSQEEISLAIARLPPIYPKNNDIRPLSLAKRVLTRPTMFVTSDVIRVQHANDLIRYVLTLFSILCAMTEAFAFQVSQRSR